MSSQAIRRSAYTFVAAVVTLGAFSDSTRAADATFADLSIEELMNEPVTLVSKRETRLLESPAAVSVVTQDDIRRLGISSIPEALRLVSGMFVGQIDNHTYAVSARGFAGVFSDKMLIMIDGRTIYEPSFAGVHWASQDLMMEDVHRIEVIRGPGATLWGANAVNGVVNIVTRNANETQGLLVSTTFGTEERTAVGLRYGGKREGSLAYRAYAKLYNREGLVTPSGDDTNDDWDGFRSGLRMDWQPGAADELTFTGDVYSSNVTEHLHNPLLTPPYSVDVDAVNQNKGGSVLGRWTHRLSDSSDLTVQSYYTRSEYGLMGSEITADTWDFDLQHRVDLGRRNEVVWGAGYRLISDDQIPSAGSTLTPGSRDMHLYTAFVQDSIALAPERLWLTLGSKIEHNDATGIEVQPGARLLWKAADSQAVWASVARAVRTPDRFERHGRADIAAFPTGPQGPVALVSVLGNTELQAEELLAYELGYRVELSNRVSFDVAAFHNEYDKLVTFVPAAPRFEAGPSSPHLLLPQVATNVEGGSSYGAELGVQWSVSKSWRLSADYTWLHLRFMDNDFEFHSPEKQARVRSFVTLPHNLEINGSASYVSSLRNQDIPSYVRLDLGLISHPAQSLEIGIWGQNLLESRHAEFIGLGTPRHVEVPRSVVARALWSF